MSAGDLLAERARTTPHKLALVSVETGERLTYAELDARAERAAAKLVALGLQPGDRFALLAYNCVEFVDLFFAAGKVGAIIVPLSTRATVHELGQIVGDCGARLLFYGAEFADVAGALPVAGCPLAELRSEDHGELQQGAPTSAFSTFSPVRGGEGTRWPDGEAIYCLLYTSGTTGKPKGVMIPLRQILFNGTNTALNWGLRDDDVSPIFTPLYHAGGFFAFLVPIFCAGGTIVLHKGFDPAEIWRTIEEERCTVVLGVPTIWKKLMEAPQFATAQLGHVRWFISGGAPLPANIIAAYQKRNVPFKQGYGMTEVGVNCFTSTVADSYAKPGSIGRPMTFTEVRLVDAEGRDVANGDVGEMWIRGPHVSKGYWNNPEATGEAYGDEGWFRTGDLARRDADGFFFIAGRRKEMFISGGVNVYPAEIEAELVAHPLVSDAAVVAIPDETWGEVGVAFVVAPSLVADDLTSYLTARIARYKVPRQFVFLDALPRTPYGKVLKGELLALLD